MLKKKVTVELAVTGSTIYKLLAVQLVDFLQWHRTTNK
jgi:hypothetical protein